MYERVWRSLSLCSAPLATTEIEIEKGREAPIKNPLNLHFIDERKGERGSDWQICSAANGGWPDDKLVQTVAAVRRDQKSSVLAYSAGLVWQTGWLLVEKLEWEPSVMRGRDGLAYGAGPGEYKKGVQLIASAKECVEWCGMALVLGPIICSALHAVWTGR